MPNYRRWYVPGGTVFFTVVTHRRRPLFANAGARQLLGNTMRQVCHARPFTTIATVLLPDHLHAIWTLPEGDADFSNRWHDIKSDFTREWLKSGGSEGKVTASQKERGNRGVWQRRFWEHQVDDEDELEGLCDYIHCNPVKHGYVTRPRDWPASTFHQWVAKGWYHPDWGAIEPPSARRLSRPDIVGE